MLPKILIQLDSDTHASSFDAVVAIDSGVDQLLSYGGVTAETVVGLVHGAMFTRGGNDLARTAIFIGGSDVSVAEQLLAATTGAFFGPVRVSVMLDANGCNTTAAAAVVSVAKHLPLAGATLTVLGGTGPVGRRVAEMAASQGADVLLVSRQQSKAAAAANAISQRLSVAHTDTNAKTVAAGRVTACQAMDNDQLLACLQQSDAVIAAGAAGVQLLSPEAWAEAGPRLQVAVDLNAVPPAGIAPIGAMDKARAVDGRIVYGAIGVGGLKMKTHRRCLQNLFTRNDQLLDSAQILATAQRIVAESA